MIDKWMQQLLMIWRELFLWLAIDDDDEDSPYSFAFNKALEKKKICFSNSDTAQANERKKVLQLPNGISPACAFLHPSAHASHLHLLRASIQ
jgi:hypothetical protein